MADTKMSEIIKASMEGVRGFTEADTVIGEAITTPSGVTVIPVSRVTVAIATGGIDYEGKRSLANGNFGGGGGTGLSITPIAFLTVNRDAEIGLVHLQEQESGVGKLASIIEQAPDYINKIKEALS